MSSSENVSMDPGERHETSSRTSESGWFLLLKIALCVALPAAAFYVIGMIVG